MYQMEKDTEHIKHNESCNMNIFTYYSATCSIQVLDAQVLQSTGTVVERLMNYRLSTMS